jgi:hypothetical protein
MLAIESEAVKAGVVLRKSVLKNVFQNYVRHHYRLNQWFHDRSFKSLSKTVNHISKQYKKQHIQEKRKAHEDRENATANSARSDFQGGKAEPANAADSRDAARNKGMALFPRKVGGEYLMLGRQDGQNLYLLHSDRLDCWEGGQLLLEPRYPWEFIQIGNCGPPIEIDEGWLVLTHGVGAMRKYSIGALLLDKDDPSIVLGRSVQPILSAVDEDREGYVPNVVYTCGAIRVGADLFLPYGVADSSVCFGFFPINSILASMHG